MVTLPNDRTFVGRYKRVTRDHLPANIRLEPPYKHRAARRSRRRKPRRIQQGRGFGSILKLAKKIVRAPVLQKLGKIALKELPCLYSKGTNKIKNKKIRKILQSDLANTLLDMGAEYG